MIEVRVRLAGIEVAKWLHRVGRKYDGPLGEPVAEGIILVTRTAPVFVDVHEVGGKRYRSLPYIDSAEAEFALCDGALPGGAFDEKGPLASLALRALVLAGIPVDGATAIAVEIKDER